MAVCSLTGSEARPQFKPAALSQVAGVAVANKVCMQHVAAFVALSGLLLQVFSHIRQKSSH